ncbi:MAG: PKD domain-containing protein [Flavobacteriales bacterium]|nr:PKD domain-containing protein [Flavobacteriales bacterium]
MRKFYFLSFVVGALLLLSCNKEKVPRASFIYKQDKGGIVTFTNTSAGVVDELVWSFGDDSPLSSEVAPQHRFIKAGTYSVSLTATNSAGSNTYTESIDIVAGVQLSFNDHPRFKDASGYFYARNIYEFDPGSPLVFKQVRGSAVAALYDSTNFLVSVGKVNVNGDLLEHNADNSYAKEGKDSSWYYSNPSLYWSADGGNGYPAMVENVPFDFPEISGIITNALLRSDSLFVLKLAKTVNLADSVIWLIEYKGETMAEKHTAGGVNGVVFTKAELSKLVNSGNYTSKVIAFNVVRKTHNFKKVYYTKESYTEADLVVR